MERSVFRYILRHTWRDQVLLLVVTAVGFPLIYINLEIPKRIVNSAIGGKDVPSTFLGFEVTQISYLFALSVLLLTLITVNGAIKYWLNVYRGVVGERTMRRLRYELYQKVLLFPLPQFKTMSAGEIIPMIVSETEPIGSFVGESFNLPVFQGGLLLTYLVFIFNQNPWLGLAAVALYPPQVYLIPRLQRKINALAKDRVQTARALSDRIGESVAGAAEIRSNHTFYLEGADISDRLGTIYGIRVDIYKRKFFVKFLNNFLAQVTPFFFYSVGGYFVINGELSLGALVAVLGAYKDILNPWKELLAWYSTKEDVRIKYEQIVSQFEPPGLIDSRLIAEAPPVIPRLVGEVAAQALTYSEDGVTNRVDRVSFRIASGEHVALVGSHSGKDDLAFLLARLLMPSSGRIVVAGANFAEVHQAVPGRRVGYATQNAHVFSGTLAHNLYYGLKQQPVRSAVYDEHELIVQKKRVHDALAAGNIPYDVHADWIDYDAAGVADSSHLIEAALAALRLVEMNREVVRFGLASTVNPQANPAFAAMALQARARIRERVQREGLEPYIELFDRNAFHANSSIAENLLFGAPRRPEFQLANLATNPEIVRLLRDVGLLEYLYSVGAKVVGMIVERFANVPPDSPIFEQFSHISADDLPEFRTLRAKIAAVGLAEISDEEKARLLALTFLVVPALHRLGVLDESGRKTMMDRIVAARSEFQRRYAERDDVIDFFDADRFSPALSIQDNILFGRVAFGQANAVERVTELFREVATEIGMEPELLRLGLEYEVGNGGSRLSYSQRQRLAIARAIMKNPDIVVFNEPTSGLDPSTEVRIVRSVLGWAKGRTVVWTLGRADLAREFDRVVVLDDGRVVEQGSFAELEQAESALTRLLA